MLSGSVFNFASKIHNGELGRKSFDVIPPKAREVKIPKIPKPRQLRTLVKGPAPFEITSDTSMVRTRSYLKDQPQARFGNLETPEQVVAQSRGEAVATGVFSGINRGLGSLLGLKIASDPNSAKHRLFSIDVIDPTDTRWKIENRAPRLVKKNFRFADLILNSGLRAEMTREATKQALAKFAAGEINANQAQRELAGVTLTVMDALGRKPPDDDRKHFEVTAETVRNAVRNTDEFSLSDFGTRYWAAGDFDKVGGILSPESLQLLIALFLDSDTSGRIASIGADDQKEPDVLIYDLDLFGPRDEYILDTTRADGPARLHRRGFSEFIVDEKLRGTKGERRNPSQFTQAAFDTLTSAAKEVVAGRPLALGEPSPVTPAFSRSQRILGERRAASLRNIQFKEASLTTSLLPTLDELTQETTDIDDPAERLVGSGLYTSGGGRRRTSGNLQRSVFLSRLLG